MALRTIRLQNDELLRKKSKPVKEITDNIKRLLDDMAETMYDKDGVGLAAPQVGVLRRIVTIDVSHEEERNLMELINPEIIKTEGIQTHSEGCLSLPGRSGTVERPEYVQAKALNREGEEFIIEGTGLLAVALCHEIDHLDGILYTDKVIEMDEYDDEDDEEYDDEEDEPATGEEAQ